MEGNSSQICPDDLLDRFAKDMTKKLWRVNRLMLVNAVLMLIVVLIGVCAPRARRSPLIGFVLLGASTLFLPIVSDVAATISSDMYFTSSLFDSQVVAGHCEPGMHLVLVLVWTVVVVAIGANTSIVAVADAREGRTVQPSIELLTKAIWIMYLIVITRNIWGYSYTIRYIGSLLGNEKATSLELTINFSLLMLLPYNKIVSKHIVFYFAQRWVNFGRNPQLIVSYMAQLRESRSTAQINGDHTPKLIVRVHERYYKLVEQPRGFSLDVRKPHRHKNNDEGSGNERKLVTLERVWEQPDDTFLKREHKELCFSCALFKLLRCRFAKYAVAEAGFMEAQFFFRREYLSGNKHHDRVFEVIADELSFINSHYNSSVPIYYAGVPVFMSYTLLSLGYCMYMFSFISRALNHLGGHQQVLCLVWCPGQTTQQNGHKFGNYLGFGKIYYDVIPVYLVLAVLLLSEVKDIVYLVCSNWTKVALICSYIQHTTSPAMKKCIGFMVNRCRWKLVNSWGDKMSQCSILVHCPWWKPNPYLWRVKGFPSWRLFGFPKEKSTKGLISAVKKSVYRSLRKEDLTVDQEGGVKHIRRPSPPVTVPDGCKSVADTILAWHIATNLFELKDRDQQDPESNKDNPASQSSDSDNKIAATHLSRYCAYLVACRPELLPDEDEWCKKLYGDVLEHAHRLLREAGGGAGFQRLVELLMRAEPDDDDSRKVLENGATLAQRLVDDPNKGWKELADFWSEMILYIAPSENLDAHAEAIARGGELVTLLWALLAHAGIVDRLVDAAADTNNVAGDGFNTSAEEAPNTAGDHHV